MSFVSRSWEQATQEAKAALRFAKEQIQTGTQQAKEVTKEVTSKIGQWSKEKADRIVSKSLKPFESHMRSMLKSKGITPKSGMTDLAEQFYNNIVKASNFESYYEKDDFQGVVYYSHPFEMPQDGARMDTIDPVTITIIISAIISFFKNMSQKRKRGEQMTDTQLAAAKAYDEVTRQGQLYATSELTAYFQQYGVWVLLGILAIVLLKKK
jgi:hypothetical protein